MGKLRWTEFQISLNSPGTTLRARDFSAEASRVRAKGSAEGGRERSGSYPSHPALALSNATLRKGRKEGRKEGRGDRGWIHNCEQTSSLLAPAMAGHSLL